MILTILIVMILATVALIIASANDHYNDDAYIGAAIMTGIMSIVSAVVLCVMIGQSVDYSLADVEAPTKEHGFDKEIWKVEISWRLLAKCLGGEK